MLGARSAVALWRLENEPRQRNSVWMISDTASPTRNSHVSVSVSRPEKRKRKPERQDESRQQAQVRDQLGVLQKFT